MNHTVDVESPSVTRESSYSSQQALVAMLAAAILSGCAPYQRTYTPPTPIYKVEKDRAGHIIRKETIQYNPQTGRCEKTVVTDKKTTYDNNATCPAALRGQYRYY